MWQINIGRLVIRVDFFLLPLLSLLVAPPVVFAAILLAAALHEAGHLAAMALFSVRCEELQLTAFGAKINAPRLGLLSYGRELCVTLAGAGSNFAAAWLLSQLSLRFAFDMGFLFAGAQLVLGVFNLLPVLPLDGGRAVYLLSAWLFGPYAGDAIAASVGLAAASAITVAALYITLRHGAGMLFLLAAAVLFLSAIQQLVLAKAALRV